MKSRGLKNVLQLLGSEMPLLGRFVPPPGQWYQQYTITKTKYRINDRSHKKRKIIPKKRLVHFGEEQQRPKNVAPHSAEVLDQGKVLEMMTKRRIENIVSDTLREQIEGTKSAVFYLVGYNGQLSDHEIVLPEAGGLSAEMINRTDSDSQMVYRDAVSVGAFEDLHKSLISRILVELSEEEVYRNKILIGRSIQ